MMGRRWHGSNRRPAGRDRGGRCGHFGEPDRGSVPTVPRLQSHRDAIRPALSVADGASVPTVPQIAALRGEWPPWGFASMAQPSWQPAAAGEALAARCRTPARPARLAALWPALPVWRDWAWCRPPQRSLSASERSLCGERPRASTGRQLPGLHAGAAETRCKVPGRPPLAAHPAQRPASTARGSAQRQLFDGVDTRKVAAVL